MQHHQSSASHCVPPEACLVSAAAAAGLQYPTDYSSTADPYGPGAVHHHHTGSPAADFPSSAMYVNTVWGPEQTPGAHPSQSHLYYESYPGAAAAMYGYPGHMIPSQDGPFPGMQSQQLSESGKRKRRRVISFEQRKAANVRERKRMCHLNDAFDVLRKRVPTFAYEKKLSRIETLKLAVTYIQYMAELLDDIDDSEGSSPGRSDACSTEKSSAASPSCEKGDKFRMDDDSTTSPSSAASSSAD